MEALKCELKNLKKREKSCVSKIDTIKKIEIASFRKELDSFLYLSKIATQPGNTINLPIGYILNDYPMIKDMHDLFDNRFQSFNGEMVTAFYDLYRKFGDYVTDSFFPTLFLYFFIDSSFAQKSHEIISEGIKRFQNTNDDEYLTFIFKLLSSVLNCHSIFISFFINMVNEMTAPNDDEVFKAFYFCSSKLPKITVDLIRLLYTKSIRVLLKLVFEFIVPKYSRSFKAYTINNETLGNLYQKKYEQLEKMFQFSWTIYTDFPSFHDLLINEQVCMFFSDLDLFLYQELKTPSQNHDLSKHSKEKLIMISKCLFSDTKGSTKSTKMDDSRWELVKENSRSKAMPILACIPMMNADEEIREDLNAEQIEELKWYFSEYSNELKDLEEQKCNILGHEDTKTSIFIPRVFISFMKDSFINIFRGIGFPYTWESFANTLEHSSNFRNVHIRDHNNLKKDLFCLNCQSLGKYLKDSFNNLTLASSQGDDYCRQCIPVLLDLMKANYIYDWDLCKITKTMRTPNHEINYEKLMTAIDKYNISALTSEVPKEIFNGIKVLMDFMKYREYDSSCFPGRQNANGKGNPKDYRELHNSVVNFSLNSPNPYPSFIIQQFLKEFAKK